MGADAKLVALFAQQVLQPQQVVAARDAGHPHAAVVVEHQVEGLVVFAQWPLVAAEARAAEFGEQAQALVVAAAQGQALFGVLLVGVADQRVDQPGGLFQLRVQMLQRVAAVDQDVGAAALAQFAEQGEEGSELLEGFAAGDGDALGLL